jgi:Secretion system C-terminal sorting domain
MNPKKLILLILFYFLIGFDVQAQEAIITSGGNASGSGGAVSFSVGQLVYATYNGSNGSIASGVQQAYEISEIISDPNNILNITLEYKIFPNPTTDFLTLNIANINNKKLSYFLYNSNGTLIENKEIKDNETVIVMAKLVSSIYFLKIIEGQRELKTFKIIKN